MTLHSCGEDETFTEQSEEAKGGMWHTPIISRYIANSILSKFGYHFKIVSALNVQI